MWPYNPVTKAKFVLKNQKKMGFMEALDQMENTPEIVAMEGVGEEVVVPEVASLERLEKEVEVPEVSVREAGDVSAVTAVERGEEELEVPEVEASSKTMELAQTKMSRKRIVLEVEANVTPGSAEGSTSAKKRVRFSKSLVETSDGNAEEWGELTGVEETELSLNSRQGINVLLPKGESDLDTEEEDQVSSSVETLHRCSLGGCPEQEDSLVKSPLRPALPYPARTTSATLSDSPVVGSNLPAPAWQWQSLSSLPSLARLHNKVWLINQYLNFEIILILNYTSIS